MIDTAGLTPLHTRMVSLRLAWGPAGSVVAVGRIFDLRKRGLVPLAGKLQGPGVVHDMAVRMELDYPVLRIRAIEPSMSAFPFAPHPATRGESCTDRLPDVQRLVGASLRDGYGPAVVGEVGGPRGCFHIFTLLRLIGPTIEWAVAREQRRRPDPATAPAPGSPLFARSAIVDGMKPSGLALVLRGMLFDLHYPPGADALPLEEEMDEAFEAAADVAVELPAMQIVSSAARIRRTGSTLATPGEWETVATAAGLVGRGMFKGYTAEVQALFGEPCEVQPLVHLLFLLAPTMLQCMPSLLEELNVRPRRVEGTHAAVDSCHMWRAGGPLANAPLWKE